MISSVSRRTMIIGGVVQGVAVGAVAVFGGHWWLTACVALVAVVSLLLLRLILRAEQQEETACYDHELVQVLDSTKEMFAHLQQELSDQFASARQENHQVQTILSDAISKLIQSFTELDKQSSRQQELAAAISGSGSSGSGQMSFNQLFTTIEHSLNNLLESTQNSSQGTRDLFEAMAQTQNQFQSVISMLNDVRKIADQTNLLAVNASVEAARAGAAGSGFAVVAEEVRNLSIRSNRFSQQIDDSVQGIARSLQQVERAMHKLAEDSERLVEEEKQQVDVMMGEARRFHDVVDGGAREIGEISQQIALLVGAAVTSMQFQDMATQVVDTVTRRMDAMDEMMSNLTLLDVNVADDCCEQKEMFVQHMAMLRSMIDGARETIEQSHHNPVSQKSMDDGDIELF
ncbi:MAG: chemotaxis protein [Desulfuromonadaceae bacterium]|nr:chemotaxis protein [Desulfuromonadaceae bacterium]